ncbi:MAG: hypothetical protein U0794_23545 [Isosphaeraceae bacterium]
MTPTGPDVTALVPTWPTLPEAIRAGILAMVKAAWGTGVADDRRPAIPRS